MLLVSIDKVKLKKTYAKILYLSTAYQNTYVFLGMYGPGKDILVHCDKEGTPLFQHKFDNSVDSFGMLTQKQVFVLETRKNKISMFNLEQKKIQDINHHFLLEESDQSSIQTFPQSRLVCVKQQGRYNDNRFKLSYYGWPFEAKSKPVAVYESKDDQWTYQYLVRKGNNHSMIIWFKNRHDSDFQFKTFDVRDDPKGIYNHHVIKNTIGLQYNIAKIQCAVCNVWEMKRGQLLAVCISNKAESKAISQPNVINNNFVINTMAGIVRQAKFHFDKDYNDYLIDYINFGHISMFRTFAFQDGISLPSPVYYIHNQSQGIIAQEQWCCSYKNKYFLPSFDNSTLVEGQYENAQVSQFVVKVKKIMDPKQIAMHFLLHLNDEFDDDLLKDAIQLLGHID